ncbi:MAG: GlcNAc-transferase family protein, partial [Alphaproteobacteria bacterium]
MAGDTSKKRIFVQMVSYRDPECHPTLRDMFEKASHPERITVGLCWQYDPDEDMECFAEEYPRADQVKVLQYHIRDAQGAGWARQEAQSLWAGEEYTMQVQAHMRFEPGWDETLIHMYEGIPAKKKVLTGWPPRYTPPNEKVETPGLFPITGVNMLGRENDAQIVHLLRRLIPIADVPANPMITATWVGCFLFAESDVFKKVPFDPHIYFWGEEINYSARLWTHGYDMYHMNKVVLYHYWSRHEGAKGAVDYRDHQNKLNRLSLMRNRHVLGLGSAPEAEALVNIEKYSLGTERTLADYLRFYGIDLIQRTVLPFAKMGYWHDTGKVNQRKPGEAPRIFVAVASYRDPELSPTLADMFAKATDNSRLRVGICLQHDPDTDKNCGIVCDYPKQCRVMEMHYRNSQGANWARAQAMSMRKDEDYVLMIDSHMRFEPGWDNTLIDMLSRCPAEKPVLSAYLSNYTPPDDRMYHPGHLLRIRVRKLGEDKDPQLIHITGVYVRRDDVHRAPLYPSPFVAGNFIFAYHTMFDEVPIDPHFHFYGDETSFAARLWTHGYDVFQPDGVVLYHYWVREQHLPLQHYRRTDTRRSQLAYARGRALLGMERIDSAEALKDIELYGLGDKRELDAFWKFAGIDWKKNEVTQQAQEGWWNMEERDKGSSREDIWQTVKEKDTAPAAKKVAPKKPAARKAATKKKVAKKTAKQSELPTIFVQIASYRDPECQWTVKDLFAKAKCPERIHVGICWQFIKDEDKKCFVEPYPYPDQVRVLEFDARESKGVCWARYELQKLYKGEDFSLQIDSHMRFEQDWDETLVQLWDDCKNDHAILTCYPPGYTPPDTLYRDFIHGMGAQRFDDNGILLMKGRPAYKMDKLPEKPMPGAFASGCMLFGPGRMVKEVPYDPHLYFFGEEITLAVRLWTHGFDLFHPNKPVVYHNWKRDKRPTHFSDHENWPQINKRSFARVRHLLGMETSSDAEVIKDIRKYGLGKKRSLKEYEEFSGVDFAARTFSHRARDGVYGEEKKEIADKKINLAIKNKGGGEPKIFVQIASYRDRECQYTIQDLFEKAKNPDRLNVGVCWQYDPDEDADCFQVITRPEQVQMLPYDWREGEGVCWARNQTQQLWNGEEYTLQIDS